ncbi:hypothetical protein HBI65_112770 [Parastagonospora nodorum]|nr:hypothetical protein HBI65_112770 [Parastagonospora nodorum]
MNLALLLNLQGARKRVLYKQTAARTSLSAKFCMSSQLLNPASPLSSYCNADRVNNNNNNIAPTLQFSLTALLNSRLLALKRSVLSGSDLNCRRTDPTIATSLAKRIKTDKDRKKSTHSENNRNNLNIIVTNPTSREFGRVDIKSLTRLYLLIDGTDIRRKQASESPPGLPFLELISITLYIYVLRSVNKIWADVADVFNTVVSKLDEVPTQELSSYIKTELLRDNSCKFYHLVITSEDTHCKQIIKKAYIISLERALLILFMI